MFKVQKVPTITLYWKKINAMSSTFSWTLKSLGGFPFDLKYLFNPKSSKRFKLPFNVDDNVTFTKHTYPDTITWTLALELKGTMMVWCILMEVYVTILNKTKFVSWSTTLKFCFAKHYSTRSTLTWWTQKYFFENFKIFHVQYFYL